MPWASSFRVTQISIYIIASKHKIRGISLYQAKGPTFRQIELAYMTNTLLKACISCSFQQACKSDVRQSERWRTIHSFLLPKQMHSGEAAILVPKDFLQMHITSQITVL